MKNRIDNFVFQYTREAFNIKSRISKENIMTNIMLNYNQKAVNKTTKQVTEVTKTVSSHGKFIVEQGQYNDDAETDKANCTLITRDLEKLEITLSEGQRGTEKRVI